MEMDPVSGKVKPFLVRAALAPFKGCNDLFFAANGDLYFTDQGLTGHHDPTGRLFRLTTAGRLECLLAMCGGPNGLVMNLAENMVFLAVTRGNCVWQVPLGPDGGVAKVGTYIQLSGGWGGPDGLALDAEGRLFVAHVGLGSVWVFDAFGEPVYRIRSCAEPHTTNMAFGGEDDKTLFITESGGGSILKVEMDIPGKPIFSHA